MMDWQKLLSSKRFRGARADLGVDTGDDVRSAFEKDADRIIFSSAFRRLQGKTQVHPFPRTDYLRTRLTHSLEAAHVARTLGSAIGRDVLKNFPDAFRWAKAEERMLVPFFFADIAFAATLAHDIGNPPFGHAGEDAIRAWFTDGPGNDLIARDSQDKRKQQHASDLDHYEGNALGFRILTRLQGDYDGGGLRLTCAALGAFSKYPRSSISFDPQTSTYSPRSKFGFFSLEEEGFVKVASELGLKRRDPNEVTDYCRHPLAFIVEAADDICYTIADIEDAAKEKILPVEGVEKDLSELIGFSPADLKTVQRPEDKMKILRAKAIGELIGQCKRCFLDNYDRIMSGTFFDAASRKELGLIDNIEKKEIVAKLKGLARKTIYPERAKVQKELSGFNIIFRIMDVFSEAFQGVEEKTDGLGKVSMSDKLLEKLSPLHARVVRLLPAYETISNDRYDWLMRLCDYFAGMTDEYITALYQNLSGIVLGIQKSG
jgi:dGTPase